MAMRYCTHPAHIFYQEFRPIPWIKDGEPDHVHEKPRMRLVDGEWRVMPPLEKKKMSERTADPQCICPPTWVKPWWRCPVHGKQIEPLPAEVWRRAILGHEPEPGDDDALESWARELANE